jgi:hypothetical protein
MLNDHGLIVSVATEQTTSAVDALRTQNGSLAEHAVKLQAALGEMRRERDFYKERLEEVCAGLEPTDA